MFLSVWVSPLETYRNIDDKPNMLHLYNKVLRKDDPLTSGRGQVGRTGLLFKCWEDGLLILKWYWHTRGCRTLLWPWTSWQGGASPPHVPGWRPTPDWIDYFSKLQFLFNSITKFNIPQITTLEVLLLACRSSLFIYIETTDWFQSVEDLHYLSTVSPLQSLLSTALLCT